MSLTLPVRKLNRPRIRGQGQKNNSVGAYSFDRPWLVHRIALIHGGGARIAMSCLLYRPGVDWKYWFVVVCRYSGHEVSQNNVHGGATSATICLLFRTTILRDPSSSKSVNHSVVFTESSKQITEPLDSMRFIVLQWLDLSSYFERSSLRSIPFRGVPFTKGQTMYREG